MATAALTVRVPRGPRLDGAGAAGLDLFRAAPAPQAVLDPTGTVHLVNRAMERILGVDGALLSGRPLHRFLDRTSRSDWCAHVRAVFASGAERRVDVALPRTGPEQRWVRVVTAPIDDGTGVPRALVTALDVTEERAAAARLRASEEGFRRLVEGSPDAVFLSRDGRLIYVNAAGSALLGEPVSALLGRVLADWVAPVDRLELQARWATPGPHAAAAGRARFQRDDGVEVTAEVHVLRAPFNGAPATVTLARDLTERVALQARLAQADRLNSMGTLAAGLAHEINNPLTYMLQNSEMVREDLTGLIAGLDRGEALAPAALRDLLAESLACLEDVQEGQERVAGLVEELRGFTRSRGDVEAVDLAAVVSKALRVADSHLRYRARVEVDLQPTPPVRAVEGRLFQVVLNLLVNAGQAIPDGDPDAQRVRVTLDAIDGLVRLRVSDTGTGIPRDVLDRIFDPFFTTKEVGEGTGLGLSICRSIVEDAGGSISVTTALGEGTRFEVRWPAAAAAADAPAPARPRRPTARLRVLVVDDEAGIRASLVRSLGRQHSVAARGSLEQAVELITQDDGWDLILCDLLMDDGTGMDLHRWLEAHHPALAERAVYMTGGAFVPQARDFAAARGDRLLQKPVSLDALDALLAERAG